MMPNIDENAEIKPAALAVRDSGAIRSTIRQRSFDEPGLVVAVERLDLEDFTYRVLCELRPEDVGDFIESLTELRSAAREASANLAKARR